MIENVKRFIYGISRVSTQDFRLKNIELIRFKPGETSLANLKLVESVLNILWRKRATYSIEIWFDKEIEYFLYSDKKEFLEELVLRLSAVYPSPKTEFSKNLLPEFRGYIAAGFLKLNGTYHMLKTLEDFDHDPLLHVLFSLKGTCLIQFLFRPERYVIETLSGEHYVFRCRVATVVASEKWKHALTTCKRILEGFSVFSTRHACLEPVFSSPFLSSKRILKSVAKRRFMLFTKDSFRITAGELAAIAHFPVSNLKTDFDISL